MTADGADKMTRFVDLAETFRLPVVHLVDQPGLRHRLRRRDAPAPSATARAPSRRSTSRTVPWASVLVRRVLRRRRRGAPPHSRHTFRVAWPSGDWGSLPIEGGLEVAFKRMLAEAGEDAERLKAEIAERLEAVRSPFRTAEAFLVEDVIDPADTRPLLTDWVHSAYDVLAARPRNAAAPRPYVDPVESDKARSAAERCLRQSTWGRRRRGERRWRRAASRRPRRPRRRW